MAYHRILKIVRLRGRGVTDRDRQGIFLFVHGARLSIGRVRRDLRRIFVSDVKKINRNYGTADLTRSAPTPAGLLSEVEFVLDPDLLERFLGTQSDLPDGMADAMRQLITDPATAEFLELALRQSVLPDPDDTLPQLKRSARSLPERLSAVVLSELDDMAGTVSGLLAHPDIGNAIVEALNVTSDEDLEVLRDYALMWPGMSRALVDLIQSIPDDGAHSEMLVASALLASFPFRWNPEGRLILLGFFISRAHARPRFLDAARRALNMRVADVFKELAARQLLGASPSQEQMEEVLSAAGVNPEYWHYWLQPGPD